MVGPGGLRTSNQAVMSALPSPKTSMIISIFVQVRACPFTFGCGVLLIIHWSGREPFLTSFTTRQVLPPRPAFTNRAFAVVGKSDSRARDKRALKGLRQQR